MVTTAEMARYLDEYAFPATREECIRMAEEHGAPDEVLAVLGELPDTVYDTIHEVWALVKTQQQ